jgi:hypothetical protein
MSNRRITVVASIMILCLVASCSQAIPINSDGARSISARQSTSPNQDGERVLADDDSDDVQSLHRNMHGSLAHVTIQASGGEGITLPSFLSPSATLESQHILLRL